MRRRKSSGSVLSFLSRSLSLAGNQFLGSGNLAVVEKEQDFQGKRPGGRHVMIHEARTMQVSIERSPDDIYAFVSNPLTLSSWARAFCRTVRRSAAAWLIDTPAGEMEIRFADENGMGVLDHYVKGESGVKVYVPMRVVPNGEGSEVMITIFRTSDMTEERFIEDCSWVLRDLQTLKNTLERSLALKPVSD